MNKKQKKITLASFMSLMLLAACTQKNDEPIQEEIKDEEVIEEVLDENAVDPFREYFEFISFGADGKGHFSYHLQTDPYSLWNINSYENQTIGPEPDKPRISVEYTSTSPNGSLSNGDTVKFTITNYEDFIAEEGITFSRTEKEFVIDNLGKPITKDTTIDKDFYQKCAEALDSIPAYSMHHEGVNNQTHTHIVERVFLGFEEGESIAENIIMIAACSDSNGSKGHAIYRLENVSLNTNETLSKECYYCNGKLRHVLSEHQDLLGYFEELKSGTPNIKYVEVDL